MPAATQETTSSPPTNEPPSIKCPHGQATVSVLRIDATGEWQHHEAPECGICSRVSAEGPWRSLAHRPTPPTVLTETVHFRTESDGSKTAWLTSLPGLLCNRKTALEALGGVIVAASMIRNGEPVPSGA